MRHLLFFEASFIILVWNMKESFLISYQSCTLIWMFKLIFKSWMNSNVFPDFKLHPSRFVSHLIHFWFCSIHLLVWGMQEFLSIIKPLWRLLSTFIPKRNMSLSWKKILTSRQVRITLYEFPKLYMIKYSID